MITRGKTKCDVRPGTQGGSSGSTASTWILALVVGTCCHLCPALSSTAHAQSIPPTPPPLTPQRYDQDYSYLADPNARSGAWWEPLKYIPLNETGDVYLTLGAEARLRHEHYSNNNWGQEPAPDDGYLWYRVLPSVDLHLGPH